MGVDEWERRVKDLRATSIRLKTQRDSLVSDHQRATDEVTRLSLLVEKLSMTGELLRALLDKLVLDQVRAIESVVTEGFKSIFFDQKLSFETEVGTARGKVSIDLLIRQAAGGNNVDIVGPPLETFGGGPSTIAALTLRILAVLRLKKFPLLILDETLAAVGDIYVEPTGQFLAKLAETTGIPILLVTHNQAYLDHAKTAYQGYTDEGSEALRLRKTRGAA